MRAVILVLMVVHGLIHSLGFIKGFSIASIEELKLPISKTAGLLWGISSLSFIAVAFAFGFKQSYWWVLAFFAVLLSQLIIFQFWSDAKYGSVANLIILVIAFVSFSSWRFEQSFLKDARATLSHYHNKEEELVTEDDLIDLPSPVKRYLRYVGVVGKPKVHNVKLLFSGEMRQEGQNWFAFNSEQYNSFNSYDRLFYMTGNIKGLVTTGYHRYKAGTARMLIKVLSIFPVVDAQGEKMLQGETVTVFNDLCLFAPAALIDKERIEWRAIDENSAKASFHNEGVSISATLHFNKKGQLVNFISDDRFAETENGLTNYPWSTPISDYQEINGLNLASKGKAIWHYPTGNFDYIKITVEEVQYNLTSKNLK